MALDLTDFVPGPCDGDVTISGEVILDRDHWYRTLRLTEGATLHMNGFRIRLDEFDEARDLAPGSSITF